MRRTWPTVRLPRSRRRRVAGVSLAVAVLVAAVVAGLELSGSSSPQYRTVPAEFGSVEQSLSLTGTIEPVSQANLNFATSGTVATVDVTVGQKVKAGGVLATLQSAQLSAQLDQAQAAYDTAQSTLTNDESPSGSIVAADSATVSSAKEALSQDETNLGDDKITDEMALSAAEQSVVSAQSTLASASLQLQNDQSTLTAAKLKASIDCQGDALAGSSVCASDESSVTSDEAQVSDDQSALSGDQSQLSQDENNVTTTQLKDTETMQQDDHAISTDKTQLTNAQAQLRDAEDGTYVDQLSSDRASVASADSSLLTAQQSLAAARLTSPISGTVIAVNVAVGDQANAGPSSLGSPTSSGSDSSGPAIEVESPGSYEVQATATDKQVGEIRSGDQVIVAPTGATTVTMGTVTDVSTIADVSSSGSVTFPVTVVVDGRPAGFYEGVSAQLTLIVLDVKHVLAVPTSAVHTLGPRSFVFLLVKGKEVLHNVTVGAVGGVTTQIKSGLVRGEQVVLANLSSVVPGLSNPSGLNGPGFKQIVGPGGGVISISRSSGP